MRVLVVIFVSFLFLNPAQSWARWVQGNCASGACGQQWVDDNGYAPQPAYGSSYSMPQGAMPAGSYRSCPNCVQSMPMQSAPSYGGFQSCPNCVRGFSSSSNSVGSSSPSGDWNPRYRVVNGDSRVVSIGNDRVVPPASAAEYQYANDGKIRFFDAGGKEIDHQGQPVASSTGGQTGSGGQNHAGAPAAENISAARAVNSEANSCRDQASKLPFKIDPKTGALSIDPENAEAKAFLKANALPALAKSMRDLLGEKTTMEEKLKKLKEDPEVIATAKKLLAVFPWDDKKPPTAETRGALEDLFGFPKGLLLEKGYPYGMDQTKLATISPENMKFLLTMGPGGDGYPLYKESVFKDEDGWRKFCLPCVFHGTDNWETLDKIVNGTTKQVVKK